MSSFNSHTPVLESMADSDSFNSSPRYSITDIISMINNSLSSRDDIECLINYTLQRYPSYLPTLSRLFPDLKMSSTDPNSVMFHTSLALAVIENLDTPASVVVAVCKISLDSTLVLANPVIVIRAHISENVMTQSIIDRLYLYPVEMEESLLERARYMTLLGLLPSREAFAKMIFRIDAIEIALLINAGAVTLDYTFQRWKREMHSTALEVASLLDDYQLAPTTRLVSSI